MQCSGNNQTRTMDRHHAGQGPVAEAHRHGMHNRICNGAPGHTAVGECLSIFNAKLHFLNAFSREDNLSRSPAH